MAYLYERPLLFPRTGGRTCFRKMNYLKHKLNKVQAGLDPVRGREFQDLQDVEALRDAIRVTRDPADRVQPSGSSTNLATKHLQASQKTLDELKSDRQRVADAGGREVRLWPGVSSSARTPPGRS